MTNERIILYFLFLLFLSCNKIDTTNQSKAYSRIYGENSWGFKDDRGNIIIPLDKYSFLNPIDEEGMIYAQKGNKCGYIDINQKIIIPFIYDELSLFSEGLASAKINGKYGFLDRKGKKIIAFQFDEVDGFYKSGLAIVQKNNKYGIISKRGTFIIPIAYENIFLSEKDSLIGVSKNNKWSFFSKKGTQVTNFIYDKITFSKSSLIYVIKNKQIAYLDNNLDEIIPFGKYSYGEVFNENGLAIVSNHHHHYGVINEFGKEVVKIEYDTLERPERDYSKSNIFVARKNNYFILFDEKGIKVADKIKEYSFDRITIQSKNKSAYNIQNLSGYFGIIGDNGKVIIPAIYDEIEPFRGRNNTVLKYKGKYGLIDSNNKIIYPTDNEYIESYKEQNYYIIKKKDKVGILDMNLKTIFNFVYQDLSPCFYDKENRFIAKQNNLYGVIDRKGRIIIPYQYSEMSNWVEYGPGSDYHFVTKNKKQGLITKDGKEVIPCIYDSLFYKDDKTIILAKNGKYGVVTIQYKPIIPFIYDRIYVDFSDINKKNNEFYVSKEGKYFVINSENKVIRANVSDKEIKNKFSFELKF